MTKATGPLYQMHFRRRRDEVTDYAARLALLKSNISRAVIRKSSRVITIQISSFDVSGDKIVSQANSKQLIEFGFNGKCNSPSAYLVGLLAGTRAKQVGVKQVIADIGRQTSTKGNVLYAAVLGLQDSGLNVPVSKEIIPSKDRVEGKHLKTASNFETSKQKILSNVKEAKTAK